MSIIINPYRFSGGGGSDPFFANVSSLLHIDNVGGAFTDVKGKVWTPNGGADIDATHPRFGAGAGNFTSINRRISTPAHADFNFGTGDFTVEWWGYLASLSGFITPYSYGYTGAGGLLLQASGAGAGTLTCYINGSAVCTEGSAPSTGVYIFYRVKRIGTAVTIERNGTGTASGSSSGSISQAADLEVGGANNGGGHIWNGWMDDVRVTKGVGRTDGVPTSPFPDS